MKRKEWILNLIAFTLIIVPLILLQLFGLSSECEGEREVNNMKIEGKVLKKFLDKKEHLYPVLIINGQPHRLIIQIDNSKFYNFVEVGDSLKKEKGNLDIRVIRAGLDTVFTINYGCENNR